MIQQQTNNVYLIFLEEMSANYYKPIYLDSVVWNLTERANISRNLELKNYFSALFFCIRFDGNSLRKHLHDVV